MIKTLTKVGNSHALVLDKTTLDALGVSPQTPLNVTVSAGRLTIEPANVGIGTDAARRHAAALRDRYGQTLKRLAE